VEYQVPENSADYFTRSGYRFIGWSRSSTDNTPSILPGSLHTFNSNVNLYACWELETYDVAFHVNNAVYGSLTVGKVTCQQRNIFTAMCRAERLTAA